MFGLPRIAVVTGWRALAAIVAGLAVVACTGAASPSAGSSIQVSTTTTVLADLVRRVGGDRVEVRSMVPKGGEVHTFDPSPQDVARLTEADLIVANGLGLDDWLTKLSADAGATAPVVRLAEGLPDDVYLRNDETGTANPHLWLDPELAGAYVDRIAEQLAAVDAAGADAYERAASEVKADLSELDSWAAAQLAAIPVAERRIVSFHDALPYLARAYDIELVGVVVESPGQEPPAREVAALIDEIRRTGVRAIASEVQFDDRIARSIADEAGATIVSDLYTDSLGDPPVDTYEGIIRWDVERLVAALGSP